MNKFIVTLCSLVLAGSMSFAKPGGGHPSGGGGQRSAPVQRAPVQRSPVQHAPAQHTPAQHTPSQANHPAQGGNRGGTPVNHGGAVNHGGTVNHGGQAGHNGFANGTHGRYTGSTHVTINNRTYVSRTYVNSRGGTYHGYYGQHSWGGRPYYAFYGHWGYGPGFWGVYWNPFTPFFYPWGWLTAPWYVNYWGWYYHPYPQYIYAYQYATDDAYSDTLASAYEAGVVAGQAMSSSAQGGSPMTEPEHDQLAQQTSDLSRDMQAGIEIDVTKILTKKPDYLFVVGSSTSFVADGSTTPCTLTGGDLFKVVAPPTESDDSVKLVVVSVKPFAGSCTAGSVIPMSVSDLQENLNSWAERVEKGNHNFEIKKLNGAATPVGQL